MGQESNFRGTTRYAKKYCSRPLEKYEANHPRLATDRPSTNQEIVKEMNESKELTAGELDEWDGE